jgi:hypothetical protein
MGSNHLRQVGLRKLPPWRKTTGGASSGAQGEDVSLAVAGRDRLALVAYSKAGEGFVVELKDLSFSLGATIDGCRHHVSLTTNTVAVQQLVSRAETYTLGTGSAFMMDFREFCTSRHFAE